ncbi:HNH endonuclease [Phaeodactylibacter xiamenensis]|uniref:HNH endonuclease signature motif containing protein n=1 Tax=Phaeodactylibacter xiamenensis TaxID=1524460 RepID=UPI003CCC0972
MWPAQPAGPLSELRVCAWRAAGARASKLLTLLKSISAKEFPDFTGFTAKTTNGIPLAKKFDNLKGNDDRIFDNNKANTWLQNSGHLNDFDSYWINPTYGSPVKLTKNGVEKTYTWHHHENGKTMMLVEQSVHNSVQHVGGASLISSGATTSIDDFATIFPDPAF